MSCLKLRQFVAGRTGIAHREANIIFHNRLAFAMAPFVFSLFGSALALRMRRGSRGFGVLVSLLILIAYYLVTLGGEQAARAGSIPPIIGAWLSTAVIVAVGVLILVSRERQFRLWFRPRRAVVDAQSVKSQTATSSRLRFRRRLSIANFPTLLYIG